MGDITSKKFDCAGCTACSNFCPVGAINIVPNDEGFYSPVVNEEKCTSCGLCINICPQINLKKNIVNKEIDTYAIVAKDEIGKKKSSSGGVFPVLAKKIIEEGGFICGAIYNKEFKVEHILSDKIDDISKMQGSKYVQSNLKNVFSEIYEVLKQDKKVLFVGTPCQVAGLKNFVAEKNISAENLFICDLICYGVPSPKFLEKYLKEVFEGQKILSINMREKKDGKSYIRIQTDKEDFWFEHSFDSVKNLYMKSFFKNLCLNKSCEKCLYSNINREGDLTLGDFWGIEKFDKKINSKKGVSCVLVNNDKGKNLLLSCKKDFDLFKKVPLKYSVEGQPRLNFPTKVDYKKRKFFFESLKKDSIEGIYQKNLNDKSEIKIINYWFAVNYGASLTCYALKRFIEKQGYSVKTINYVEENIALNRKYETSGAKAFAEEFLNLTKKYSDLKSLKELNNNTETFVVGSDQVWRYDLYKFHGGNIYQLDFVNDDRKKIAYSASFGADKFIAPQLEKDIFKHYIKRFNAISVREKSGLKILENDFGIKGANHILDPVFTLEEDDIKQIISDKKENRNKYIASFRYLTASQKEWCVDFETKFAGKKGLSLEKLVFTDKCDIKEFVSFIKNCDFLISDSFHAICFAILFKKPFVILGLADEVVDRMHSLLETFDIDKKLLIKKEEMVQKVLDERISELSEIEINYDNVAEIIEKEKKVAQKWFEQALKKPNYVSDEKDIEYNVFIEQKRKEQEVFEESQERKILLKKVHRTILAFIVFKVLEKIFKKNQRFKERRKYHSTKLRKLIKMFVK